LPVLVAEGLGEVRLLGSGDHVDDGDEDRSEEERGLCRGEDRRPHVGEQPPKVLGVPDQRVDPGRDEAAGRRVGLGDPHPHGYQPREAQPGTCDQEG